MLSKIGIRPVIDGRQFGIRESLEVQTMNMAKAAAELISSKVRHASGEPMECVIADTTIGGIAESAACADKFATENIVATLTVTPCWCYVTQVIDENPNTIKAVWGFNGTERPGAVFLAAANSSYAQIGMPCFSIYGHDVKDADDTVIPSDVEEKILRFARCAAAVGDMKNKSYVNIGSQAMGIAGAYCNEEFFRDYLGIHPEWVDMTEIIRREKLGIYDEAEYKKALAWIKEKCPEDVNKTLLGRTDPTWPSTWFAPITVPDKVAVSDVYNVMANWGANHGCFVYGHIGEDLVTLASMLRIPVSLHNLSDDRLFRPHAWSAFGTTDLEGADYRACAAYGSLYK